MFLRLGGEQNKSDLLKDICSCLVSTLSSLRPETLLAFSRLCVLCSAFPGGSVVKNPLAV